jgi:hypothetical protein
MAIILGLAAAALVLAPTALTQDDQGRPPLSEALILTYWEARAAGLPVTLRTDEMRMPICPKGVVDPGLATGEEEVVATKPPCRADPAAGIYGFGWSLPLTAGAQRPLSEELAYGLGRAGFAAFAARVWVSVAASRVSGLL